MIDKRLLGILDDRGLANPDMIGRGARLIRCRSCSARILAGLDGDRAAGVARVDPLPLSGLGEMLAHFDGLSTYALSERSGRVELDWREPLHMRDSAPERADILADHQCYRDTPGGSCVASRLRSAGRG